MDDFWHFYLHEHSRASTRALHLVGTTLAALFILAAIWFRSPWLLLGAAVWGYSLAWVGHFFFEHNRPATFRYPLRSLAADWKMWALFLMGRLGKHLERHGVAKGS